MIKQRLKYSELSPAPYKGMVAALMALEKGALDKATIELMFMRVSQINGCAYCLDMHGKALRESGVDNAKLDQLAGWRVSHAFSDRERAALEWADSVTLIAATGAPDSAFEALQTHFSEAEIADLTFAISIMNAFNRLAISMRQ
ncbi:carboxymuconolactone decarboxylase family protein [Serratia liquefaciens]|uniref:carboxymuconolactone decarboxylase family protein n=1 Tax=Serratia liquefaciens TaxID=614 RepID=UPI00065FE721|nr:carboxymuconolactone decarboxylase family protein [Serratia liquefaciens]AMH00859.1 carboxymuconolactone decarboxylase family protein [Serratia liquefaciens]RYM82716.1 alkylhydroperoxidase [Serratia liquefaciens]SUI43852.1 Argininosuccinate synthase [Serratia liquefaciens]HEI8955872.1 carboxymuconolactone decarboxylase family protein [Serratia liquefaciens]